MAEFTKLSAVEAVEAVSETANVLIEENGVIKRAPKDEIGGGIKVASTAKVGQTIVVKAVDDAGNPTEWECADNVASWNDLTDKPFYEEAGVAAIIPETTLEFTATGISGTQNIENVSSIGLIQSDTYIVTWDGQEYQCVCDYCYENGIGDNSIITGTTSGDFNSEAPFFIHNNGQVMVKEIGTYTFKIEKDDIVVKPLDEKYLPNHEHVVSWNNLEDRPFGDIVTYSPCFEEQTVTFTTNSSNNYAHGYMTRISNVPWDATCRVVFDGIVYDNIAAHESGGDMCVYVDFTTEDGNEISINSEGKRIQAPAALAGEHTVAVYAIMSNTLQIDKKFIPGLPVLIKVYDNGDSNYTCDFTEQEIEQMYSSGALLYAAIYFKNNDKWVFNISSGNFYCNRYTYTDDDVMIFASLDGKRRLSFCSSGAILYSNS